VVSHSGACEPSDHGKGCEGGAEDEIELAVGGVGVWCGVDAECVLACVGDDGPAAFVVDDDFALGGDGVAGEGWACDFGGDVGEV